MLIDSLTGTADHTPAVVLPAPPRKGNSNHFTEPEDLEPDTAPMSKYLTESIRYHSTTAPTRSKARSHLDRYLGGDMPMIHDAHPGTVYDNMAQNITDAWDTYPDFKLIAIPFGFDVRQHTNHDKFQNDILAAVAHITNSQEAGVSAPAPDVTIAKGDDTPRSFLIHSLTKPHYQMLLKQRIWSCPDITFRITTPKPKCPNLMFSLEGMSTLDAGNVLTMVQAIWNRPEVLNNLHTLAKDSPIGNGQPPPKIQAFVDSVDVVKMDIKIEHGKPAPVYNVFASGYFIRTPKLWMDIRDYLALLKYSDPKIGRANTKISHFDCKICNGVDHPKGLCEFPAMKGWQGPTGIAEINPETNDKQRNHFQSAQRFRR